jgi:hypothetical protein
MADRDTLDQDFCNVQMVGPGLSCGDPTRGDDDYDAGIPRHGNGDYGGSGGSVTQI